MLCESGNIRGGKSIGELSSGGRKVAETTKEEKRISKSTKGIGELTVQWGN
jgi:hypothetical protein